MSSRKDDESVFVYITLPGETSAVLAGRFDLSHRTGTPVGSFAYARSYRERRHAVELDPRELNFEQASFRTTKGGGVFGVLRDATPDSWGRRLIERRIAGGYVDLSPVQYMLNSPEDRAGALGFGLGPQPPAPIRDFNRTMDLSELVEAANALIAEDQKQEMSAPDGPNAAQIERLLLIGTAMGGARPKATVEDRDMLWVAKFPIIADAARGITGDRWNNPRVEHATMLLARECGLSCADTRIVDVGGRDVLLSRRFDRERRGDCYERKRMISGLTMLGVTEDDRDKWSYLALADEMRRRSGSARAGELLELYRRIVFNALISNIDDHPRNHAFLAHGTDWLLAPAYDLTPTPMVGQQRDLAMSLGDFGRAATRENLLSRFGNFGLQRPNAERLIHDMTAVVQSRWYPLARSVGVTEADCERIRSAFVYNGFGASDG